MVLENLKQAFNEGIAKRSDVSAMPALCQLLPYRFFDDGVFVNDDSFGFVVEFTPLYGHISQSEAEGISKLLSNGIEQNTTIQIYRWENAKSSIWIDQWLGQRGEANNEILEKIAESRHRFFGNAHKDSLYEDVPFYIRDVRCFIAVSMPKGGADTEKNIQLMKTRFLETIKGISSHTQLLDANMLLSLMHEWIHPDFNPRHTLMPYDEMTYLHHQLTDGSEFLRVKEDELEFDKMNAAVLTVVDLPLKWSSHLVAFLNGEDNNVYSRIKSPTLSVLNITALDHQEAKNKAEYKYQELLRDVEGIYGKYISDIKEQYKEWEFARNKISDGNRLVRAFQSVVVYDTPERLNDSA